MNPFPVVFSMFSRKRLTLSLFVLLVAFSVALGVAVTSQERALRQGSARAADKFELVIGAPGSQYDLVLATVYLRLTSMELLPPSVFADILAEPEVEWAAPVAFGDTAGAGLPVVGSTAQFVAHLSGDLSEGKMFATREQAVVGAEVPFLVGDSFQTMHGTQGAESDIHEHRINVVGRMQATHTPWDRAIIIPVEAMWTTHGLPDGHLDFEPVEHAHDDEAHHDGEHGDEAHEHAGPLGPPFDREVLPGVPAVVVKATNLAAAYGLRNKYRTAESLALFPAEVLVQLYALMGDARGIVQWLAMATQTLVVAAVLSGLVVIQQLYTQRLAILRALGASQTYVFLVVWLYFTLLVAAGAMLGLALGYAVALGMSRYLGELAGFGMSAILGEQEFYLTGGLLMTGALLALIPAFSLFRRPVIDALR